MARKLIRREPKLLDLYEPYEWQAEFHNAGRDHPERMLCAANRVGKTCSAACEVVYHLTGHYPLWWQGKRFNGPVQAWVGSPTNETSKYITQTALIGGLGEALGSGWIPIKNIVGTPTNRQSGIKDTVEAFQVRHKLGGLSTCYLKTYEQGWQKWQGGAPHIVWLDEEPEDYKIFSEAQTRVLTSGGIVLVTFTPLHGATELVDHFQNGGDGIYFKQVSWAEAPHLSAEEKRRLTASYRDHERGARTEGIPMMGEGSVFPVSDEDIKVDPFKRPGHFRCIFGVDFGINHPGAGALLSWDEPNDIVYVMDCYRKAGETAVYHASWFNRTPELRTVPVAWPHDGMNRERSGGKTLAEHYRAHGVNMLSKSAHYKGKYGEGPKLGAQPVEPIVDEVYERMCTGRFKVFSTLSQWFEEKRSYHRKDGRIVDVRDDILKATFYALMMLRYSSIPGSYAARRAIPQNPISTARI